MDLSLEYKIYKYIIICMYYMIKGRKNDLDLLHCTKRNKCNLSVLLYFANYLYNLEMVQVHIFGIIQYYISINSLFHLYLMSNCLLFASTYYIYKFTLCIGMYLPSPGHGSSKSSVPLQQVNKMHFYRGNAQCLLMICSQVNISKKSLHLHPLLNILLLSFCNKALTPLC